MRTYNPPGSMQIVFVLAMICGAPSTAQDRGDPPKTLEEITVTAAKRELSLQDSSISVTALSGDLLDRLHVVEFNDYIELVPTLTAAERTAETNGPRTIGLRGVQSINGTFSVGQNAVGFYIDDAVVPFSNPRLVDLERVEVLRGPQGTLYGSSAMAGVVKLVTAKPDPGSWSGMIRVDGSDMTDGGTGYTAEGMINVPVRDDLALRLSGYYDQTPGYIDVLLVDLPTQPTGRVIRDGNEVESTGFRLAGAWYAADDLTFNASYVYGKTEVANLSVLTRPTPDGLPAAPCTAFNFTLCPDPSAPIPALTGHAKDLDDPRALARFQTPSETSFGLASIGLTWSFAGADLVSTLSYYEDEGLYQTEITDIVGGAWGRDPIVLIPEEPFFEFAPTAVAFTRDLQNSEVTSETRLVSTWDRKWQYAVGIFYTDRDEDLVTEAPLGEGTFLFGSPNLSPGGSFLATVGYRGRKELSGFGELSVDLTDSLRGTVGGRLYRHEFELADTFTGNPLIVGNPTGTSKVRDSDEQDGVLGSAKLEYRVEDGTLLYGSVAEGFRMGGALFRVNEQEPSCRQDLLDTLGTTTAPTKFEPDDLISYELGVKKAWGRGRATTNLAAFQIDWDNTQVNIGALCEILGFVANAGAVRSRGVEFESQVLALDNLVLGLALSYIDSQVEDDVLVNPNGIPIAVAGDRMPNIPRFAGSLTWDLSFPAPSGFGGYFRGMYAYRDETTVLLGDNRNFADDYSMLNLRVGLAKGAWDFSAYVANALDERPSLAGQPSVLGFNAFREIDTTLPPRVIGLSIGRHFR